MARKVFNPRAANTATNDRIDELEATLAQYQDALEENQASVQEQYSSQYSEDATYDLKTVLKYNLYNAGWPTTTKVLTNPAGSVPPTNQNPVQAFVTTFGQYPAKGDLFSIGQFDSPSDKEAVGAFSVWQVHNQKPFNGEPPYGRIIVDLFNRSDSRKAAMGIPTSGGDYNFEPDFTDGKISNVVGYAGRFFYAIEETGGTVSGVGPSLYNTIVYTQVIKGREQITSCYSKNDPTSAEEGDPLDTDGGFIVIPEMDRVVKMVPFGNSLFVFATNGVWEVSGGEGVFKPLDQRVTKISSVGLLAPKSVVQTESFIMYWGKGGIYQISFDAISQYGVATNISENTIQGIFSDIEAGQVEYVSGVYDEVLKQIRWLYNETAPDEPFAYSKELVYDLTLNAFTRNEFGQLSTDKVYIAGYLPVDRVRPLVSTELVTAGGVTVTAGGDDVTVTSYSSGSTPLSQGFLKYLSIKYIDADAPNPWYLTFADLNNTGFLDWSSVDGTGVDAAGFLVTGYLTGGDSQRSKQSNYLTVHCEMTESGFVDTGDGYDVIGPSSCLVQAQWNWAGSAASNNWGTQFQAYRLPRLYVPDTAGDWDSGYHVISTKNKLRGEGRALSLKFSTEAGKDLKLLGWGLNMDTEIDI